MRTDVLEPTAGPADPPDLGRTPPPRSRMARALPVFVGALVLGTSAAVAAVAWWLVPPYLALMAFLLFEPAGRRVSATNPAGPESATSGVSTPGDTPDPAAPASPDDASASTDAPAPSKARRGGKGRGRRRPDPSSSRPPRPGSRSRRRVRPGRGGGRFPPRPVRTLSAPRHVDAPPLAAGAEAVPHDAPTEARAR